METLFALTDAMGAPLGALLPASASRPTAPVTGDVVEAVLLDRWQSEHQLVETYRATVGQNMQQSTPHAAGVEETVVVLHGTVEVGPDAQRLGPGQSLRYAGDHDHGFRAVGGDAEVLILMHYPSPAQAPGSTEERPP